MILSFLMRYVCVFTAVDRLVYICRVRRHYLSRGAFANIQSAWSSRTLLMFATILAVLHMSTIYIGSLNEERVNEVFLNFFYFLFLFSVFCRC